MLAILASALPSAGAASAEPVSIATVARSEQTDEGWALSVTLSEMMINAVPNMAATAFTKEGFVTGQATAAIEGSGTTPVSSAEVILGVQLGCKVDLSLGSNLGVNGGIASGFGGGGGALTGSTNALGSANAAITLLPGNIQSLVLGQWSLKGPIGKATVHDAHVKIDGCGGPVPIRFFAHAQISTDYGIDSVNAYADISTL